MFDHLPEPDRIRTIVMLMGVFVATIGLAVPFAAAWVTQRIIHRRELKNDVLRLLVEIARRAGDYRTAFADVNLSKAEIEMLTHDLSASPEPTAEAIEMVNKSNDKHREHLRQLALTTLGLNSDALALELVCDKRAKRLVAKVREICELSIPDDNSLETVQAFEDKMMNPKFEEMELALRNVWSEYK
jgi:hypothetical protein